MPTNRALKPAVRLAVFLSLACPALAFASTGSAKHTRLEAVKSLRQRAEHSAGAAHSHAAETKGSHSVADRKPANPWVDEIRSEEAHPVRPAPRHER
jgi:hypothetical protein